MDSQELISLALNARLNHWPPHLGLTTDEEKIHHLAQRLDEAATKITNAELLADENATLREERDDFERQAIDLRATLDQIHNLSLPPRG